jgi:hypothetical protein
MIPEEDDFHIWSPEESDGGIDWPSAIAQLLMLGLVLVMFFLAMWWWVFSPTTAHAQGQCVQMDDTDATFLKSYNEAISGAGIGEKGMDAWEVLVSPDGETFTIVRISLLLKLACIVGSGHHWAQIPVPHFSEPKQKL